MIGEDLPERASILYSYHEDFDSDRMLNPYPVLSVRSKAAETNRQP